MFRKALYNSPRLSIYSLKLYFTHRLKVLFYPFSKLFILHKGDDNMSKQQRLTNQQRLHIRKVEEKIKFMPFYVEEYVDDMLSGNCSPSTLLGYIHDYERFFQWLINERIVNVKEIIDIPLSTLETLSLKEANSFFSYLAYELELQDESINRKKSSLKSLFNFLTTRTEDEDGECYFYRNVMAKVKMAKRQETLDVRAERIGEKILHDNEIMKFIKFVEEDYSLKIENEKQKLAYFKRNKERDLAILSLLLASGLRVGELSNLRLSSINMTQRKLSVLRKGNKESIVYFRKFALSYLENYLKIREDRYKATLDNKALFVTMYQKKAHPLSIRAIQQLVMKYTKAFRDEALSPHKLRHSFATEFAKRNSMYDLMRQLGHSSTETSSLYINATDEQARFAIDRLDEK